MTATFGSTWEYREDRLWRHAEPWRASLFTIGNGYLGVRGTLEEGWAGQQPATFIHGLFVTPPGDLPVLGAVPDWTGLEVGIDGEPFRLDLKTPAGFERVLNMKTGVLTRTVVWRGVDTGLVRVVFRRTASMVDPGLVALDATFTALTQPVTIAVETGIDATVEGPYGALWRARHWSRPDATTLAMSATSIDEAHQIEIETRVLAMGPSSVVGDPSHPRFQSAFTLEAGQSRTITKFTRFHAPGFPELALPGVESGFDDIAARSAQVWDDRWSTSHVEVSGDPEAERALRYAAYSLISSAPPRDTAGSIGARLLSGYGYRHHVFWDTDVYIIPYLTVTQPDLARTHLRYRHRGLSGARRKAGRFGRAGAFYAWEAADSGDEVAPQWGQMPDGERIRIWTGEIEEHIISDVAWATDHYWQWTNDDEFMLHQGAEMILDGAKYWSSRLELEEDGAHLRQVIGPNEYHATTHVDDSFFTNAMAAWHLRTAASVLGWLERKDPDRHRRLATELSLPPTSGGEFESLADRIVLPPCDGGVWEERAGFFDLETIDLDVFQPSRVSLHELLGDKRTQEVRLVKQADVVMGLVLLDELRTPGALEANFDYYAPITDHGSSLSLAMHSLAASMIRRPELAYEYFLQAVAIDHDDAMLRMGNGIHAATQGGILQAALFGFGGLHLEGGTPRAVSRLPSHWDSFGFTFVNNGIKHERQLTQGSRG